MNSHEPVMNRRGLRKTKSCHMSGALIIFLLFDLCTTVGEIGGVSKLECPPPHHSHANLVDFRSIL